MGFKPKFKRGGRGLYCYNMKEGVEVAIENGKYDIDIAKNTGMDITTVRNWFRTGNGSKESAIKLGEYISKIEAEKFIDQPTTNDGQVVKIAQLLENLGLDPSLPYLFIPHEKLEEVICNKEGIIIKLIR